MDSVKLVHVLKELKAMENNVLGTNALIPHFM